MITSHVVSRRDHVSVRSSSSGLAVERKTANEIARAEDDGDRVRDGDDDRGVAHERESMTPRSAAISVISPVPVAAFPQPISQRAPMPVSRRLRSKIGHGRSPRRDRRIRSCPRRAGGDDRARGRLGCRARRDHGVASAPGRLRPRLPAGRHARRPPPGRAAPRRGRAPRCGARGGSSRCAASGRDSRRGIPSSGSAPTPGRSTRG